LIEDDEWKRYVTHRIKNSPVKSTQIDFAELDHPVPTLPSSPAPRLFNIASRFKGAFSSPGKSEKEDEDQEDEDENEEDSDIEILQGGDKTLLEDNEGEDDKEYTPKFQFFTVIKDWSIEKWENSYDYALDQVDDFVDNVQYNSNSLKKALSTADSVNTITSIVEFVLLLRNQVPTIKLSEATFLDQQILGKYTNYIDLDWPVFDFSALIDFKFALVVISWLLLTIVGPLIGSYYFNFIGKKQKKVKFDPLVFNLVKLLFSYFFLSGAVSFEDVKNNAQVWADEHGLLEQTTLCQKARAHLFHNSITLRLVLGNTPFISGFIGVLVALYIAAI
jgi:hypothetical protein